MNRIPAPLPARIVLASNNPGKLREFSSLFAPLGTQLVPQGELGVPEAEEPHVTFVENALAKARHASRLTGLPAIADDSGLCVTALADGPGVRSARYAQDAGAGQGDEANNILLLDALRDASDRSARYVAVLVMVRAHDDPLPVIAVGLWQGEIATAPSGASGFGYDPCFLLPELGKTVAELEPAEKNRGSHRARALRSLLAQLGHAATPA